MPSVDVVSKVDFQSLDNAINNAKREISTRFDFKNVKCEITLDRKEKRIRIVVGDEGNVRSVKELLIEKCVRLKVDPRCLDFKKIEDVEQSLRSSARIDVEIKDGIPKETCQKIVKFIKNLKFKVQPTIQDEQVRLTGKKIDDLQEIMRLLREEDYGIPLQFVNMKS